METETVIFNAFKERLINGKVPTSFGIYCYPVTDSFFEILNTDDYKVENFRTLSDLQNMDFTNTIFWYTQKQFNANYCCQFITTPEIYYRTQQINSAYYTTISSSRNTYCSAEMDYRYNDLDVDTFCNGTIAYGVVNYDTANQNFLVHFFNHPDDYNPNFVYEDGRVNDGTNIWIGYIPQKETLVNQMCQTGQSEVIYPIYGASLRGLVFIDVEGNLVCYTKFSESLNFDGGSFVYEFPQTTTTVDENGTTIKWATFISLG